MWGVHGALDGHGVPRGALRAHCACSAHGPWSTHHAWGACGAWSTHTAAPSPPCQGSRPAPASRPCCMAPSMTAPQHRAPLMASMVPSGRMASRLGALRGAWQPPGSAAHCMSPGSLLPVVPPCPQGTQHPSWVGSWRASVPILPLPPISAGPGLPAPLRSAVMDRHTAQLLMRSFHV